MYEGAYRLRYMHGARSVHDGSYEEFYQGDIILVVRTDLLPAGFLKVTFIDKRGQLYSCRWRANEPPYQSVGLVGAEKLT